MEHRVEKGTCIIDHAYRNSEERRNSHLSSIVLAVACAPACFVISVAAAQQAPQKSPTMTTLVMRACTFATADGQPGEHAGAGESASRSGLPNSAAGHRNGHEKQPRYPD